MSRRVVITGLGTVNPLGNNVETTWDNVKKGVCGIDEITRIDTTNHAVKLAGEVKNLDVTAVIDKKDVSGKWFSLKDHIIIRKKSTCTGRFTDNLDSLWSHVR